MVAARVRVNPEIPATAKHHSPSKEHEVGSAGLSSAAFSQCCRTMKDFSMLADVPWYPDSLLRMIPYHLCTAKLSSPLERADSITSNAFSHNRFLSSLVALFDSSAVS